MPFVQAKCPECGGMLAVDDSKKAAVCQFCGEAFIVQEAINNYITNNITNNTTNHNYGEGAVVNVYEDSNKDFVIEGGVLKEYHGASADVVIPDGVVEIGSGCFQDLKIKSVVIPYSVTSIGNGAFYYCTSLTLITIPDSVTKIGNRAFALCYSLTSINVAENNNIYSSVDGVLFNKDKTVLIQYPEGKVDIEYTIPNSVTSIGCEAFRGCKSLTTISIPESVTIIGHGAFYNCTSLTTLTIPDSVTSIGEYAFSLCTNLSSVITSDNFLGNFHKFENAFDYELYKKIRCEKQEIDRAKQIAEMKAKHAEEQKIIAERKSKGLCQHCGGTFKKGLFSSKCSNCGKPKDY